MDDLCLMGRLWDVRSSKVSASIKMKEQAFLFLAWSPGDPNIVATVQKDSDVYFIDLRKQKVLKMQTLHCCSAGWNNNQWSL